MEALSFQSVSGALRRPDSAGATPGRRASPLEDARWALGEERSLEGRWGSE